MDGRSTCLKIEITRQESSISTRVQPTVPAGSDCRLILKFWDGRMDGRTDGRTRCVKIMISTGRGCGRPRGSITGLVEQYLLTLLLLTYSRTLKKFNFFMLFLLWSIIVNRRSIRLIGWWNWPTAQLFPSFSLTFFKGKKGRNTFSPTIEACQQSKNVWGMIAYLAKS